MSKKYSKSYEIRYQDVDYTLKCKVASIMNFLCDIGNSQSEEVGDTIEHLTKNRSAWVFYKYDIKINKYPKYRDIITIETESIGFKKFYAYRGYTIKSSDGEVLGEAVALFFFINIDRRRPARIPEEKYEFYGEDKNNPRDIDMEDVEKVERVTNEKQFQIRYSDIDSNGHVNNVKYAELALEAVPEDIIKNYTLSRIKIIFEKETKYGDVVTILTEVREEVENEIKTVHLIKSKDGVELTKLEMNWSKK
ncbi:MAG: thioesterase [Clostridium sp.]|nr:thioesterase [Clostridium sp.]